MAILTLAVGIGANAAIFSVVNAVLLKPVPFPDPDRLVMFMNTSPQGSGSNASPAKFQHWREQTRVVQDVAAFRNNVVNFTGGGIPEQLRAGEVSADYFRLLGAPVLRGRTFSAEEDRPGGAARRGSQPQSVEKALRIRSRRDRNHDVVERRSAHGDRHHRSGVRCRRIRPATGRMGRVPARPQLERSGALFQRGGPSQARRRHSSRRKRSSINPPPSTGANFLERSTTTRASA